MTELQKTFMAYPKEEQMYMLELDKMSKVDLILFLNNLNNIRKIELEKQKLTQKELEKVILLLEDKHHKKGMNYQTRVLYEKLYNVWCIRTRTTQIINK